MKNDWLEKELASVKEGEKYDYILRRWDAAIEKRKEKRKKPEERKNKMGLFMIASGML